MLIIPLLFLRFPLTMRRVAAAWLVVVGACVSVTAPGQLYLRTVNPWSPAVYPVAPELLVVGLVAGPVMTFGGVLLLGSLRRSRRDVLLEVRLP